MDWDFKKIWINKSGYIALFVVLILSAWMTNLYALTINIVAVNASGTEPKEYPIKYYLPKELKAPDIINSGGLSVDYDVDQQAFYVSGTLNLEPKETQIIKIEVNDVWKINPEQIEAIKKQIDENVERLKDSPNYNKAQGLRELLIEKLNGIINQQESFSGNIDRRIDFYRAQLDQLQEIRNSSLSVDYWESKQGPLESVKLSEKSKGQTLKLIVELENKEAESKVIKQQHYLPKEINPEDVIDSKGFEIRYDEDKKQAFLWKEEEFQAGEKKRYEIEIKDIWTIPQEQIDFMSTRANQAFNDIRESKYGADFMSNATQLLDSVNVNLNDIQESQKERKPVKKHIAEYRTNESRFDTSREDTEELEKILAIVRQKRLEELEKSKVKNVLQRLKTLNGVRAISEALFKQKPTISTTWKIIFGILIFVAIYTTVHFGTWFKRSQAAKLKELEKKQTAKVAAKKA